jgi:hypothetical protein
MDAPHPPPRLIITLDFESSRPHVREEAGTLEQGERLRDWIRSQPDLDALAQSAILLMAGRKAA